VIDRFDRYMLSQLLMMFSFFSLILVAVYWVNRAVGLFDQLIGGGQSALVFLEFSVLTLPFLIRLVLPIAAFAAAVYVTNRLISESELVVMQATGTSAFRLARPVLLFGLLVALMMGILMHWLIPASRTALAIRTAEISQNATARFLNDGQFMHPAAGVTLYIREITPNGELRDMMLEDDRSTANRVTYTAAGAYLARGETGPKLVMIDGMAQSLDKDTSRLSVTRFSDFTYDLAGLITGVERGGRSLDELPTGLVLSPTEALIAETGESRAAFLLEGNSRFSQPLLGTAAAMIGFAALLLGAFSRFGLWRQILAAVGLLILVQLISTAATSIALENARAWPLAYLAPICGLFFAAAMLWLAERPRRKNQSAEPAL
jgi:lipopolysaccharide export system permease protein